MKRVNIVRYTITICLFVLATTAQAIAQLKPIAEFKFDGNIKSLEGEVPESFNKKISYTEGIEGKALTIKPDSHSLSLAGNSFHLSNDKDFSIQFWIKTIMDSKKPFVILSQKEFHNNSLASQKNAGWVLYSYGGTWAWNMGSGKRRITHERDNGKYESLNDGKWHQITMTYSSAESVVRLYYDGDNKALYNMSDSVGFDFANPNPIIIGSDELTQDLQNGILTEIEKGKENLQNLINEYNQLGLNKLDSNEFESVIVDPEELFNREVNKMKLLKGIDSTTFLESIQLMDLKPVMKARLALMQSRYTTYQGRDFMTVAPLLKIYSLENGKVIIDQKAAKAFTESEKLYYPDFDMDNLTIWDRAISPQEILNSYAKYFKPKVLQLKNNVTSLTAAEWNIHHGGIHLTKEKNGIDGRLRIAEMLKKENVDVVMMIETYSNGDFIAGQLGYYFATTVDKDGLNQGANISVLSRYPIKEIYVPPGSSFMNVAVKVAVSKTQDMYVMSNWFGKNGAGFPETFNFYLKKFQQSDNIPILFSGDFNTIPDSDGGDNNIASRKLLGFGFRDAYRSSYPDVTKYPGYTHQNGRRIDQFFYKGRGLKNTSTFIISDRPGGFPSDHFMIVSKFDLNFLTNKK